MIEVPITMALVVFAMMLGLGLFALFVIARYVSRRVSGDGGEDYPNEQRSQPENQPAAIKTASPAVPDMKANEEGVPVLLFYQTPKGERQVWRVEKTHRRLRRGLLTRSDEEILEDCLYNLKNLLGVDEKAAENVPVVPPSSLVMPAPAAEPKPSRNVLHLLGREKIVVEEPVSMAAQMDTILQEMLKSLPGEPINLRIGESPQGDLRIWYQSKAYHGIEEVPDGEIQNLIRTAAETWLAKNANRR